jgi:hypothetical protein
MTLPSTLNCRQSLLSFLFRESNSTISGRRRRRQKNYFFLPSPPGSSSRSLPFLKLAQFSPLAARSLYQHSIAIDRLA